MLTLEEKKIRAAEVVRALEEKYPDATCALKYEGDPWRLLVMGRLSASVHCAERRVAIKSCRGSFASSEHKASGYSFFSASTQPSARSLSVITKHPFFFR